MKSVTKVGLIVTAVEMVALVATEWLSRATFVEGTGPNIGAAFIMLFALSTLVVGVVLTVVGVLTDRRRRRTAPPARQR